ncbi:MAG: c-type cytochrome [Vicinamibacterales bacterium]
MAQRHFGFWLTASMLASALAVVTVRASAEDPKTILDRVYSVPQAERGEVLFKKHCIACHQQTEFAEPSFSATFEGQTLGDVYGFITSSMPEGNAGSLKPEEYAAVVAYFLRMGGFPVGAEDMPADKAVLSKIGIVSNPK